METFKTHEIAEKIGVHPNTIRLYEKLGFISQAERLSNGYRVFTRLHVAQMALARVALRAEVLQNGLRKKAVEIIRLSGARQFTKALQCTEEYDLLLINEITNAKAAINYVKSILRSDFMLQSIHLNRRETAAYLGVTIDTLRNWELNGLIKVKRRKNNYRIYDQADLERLRVIRTLRSANYSLTSILRLLNKITLDRSAVVENVLNVPESNETIISVCDRLLLSLEETRSDVDQMREILKNIQESN